MADSQMSMIFNQQKEDYWERCEEVSLAYSVQWSLISW